MFELRKNKWLSDGQPGYNFWLSVQVFGCPYMVALEFHTLGVKMYGCPSDNCIRFFSCPATCLVVPGTRTTEISNAGYHIIRQQYMLNMLLWTYRCWGRGGFSMFSYLAKSTLNMQQLRGLQTQCI